MLDLQVFNQTKCQNTWLYSVSGVNALDYESFVEYFSGILEHSSIVVAVLWSHQPFRDFTDLYDKLCDVIHMLPLEGKNMNTNV